MQLGVRYLSSSSSTTCHLCGSLWGGEVGVLQPRSTWWYCPAGSWGQRGMALGFLSFSARLTHTGRHYCCCFPLYNKIHHNQWCPTVKPARAFISVTRSLLGLAAESLLPRLPFYYAAVSWNSTIAPSSEGTSPAPPPAPTLSYTSP